ncbi:MAG: dihydropteroate synthase [Dinoroseobacter sp.]|jgi:dihydropteroate synthase
MGIINVTPDSFSDGGRFVQVDSALQHGLALSSEGADILDVGGESSRPGATEVSVQEELDRVIPIIEILAKETATPVSIDSYKPQVIRAAVAAGAAMINDVNALRAEGALQAAAQTQVPICLMHMQSQPKTMQQSPQYKNVVADVIEFLTQRIVACTEAGISIDSLIADPGIGFGKTLQHNLALLNAVPEMRAKLGCELLIGVSRKSMIDILLKRPIDQRLYASLGLAVQATLNGAKIVRVHDVRATYDAVRCVEAVSNSS